MAIIIRKSFRSETWEGESKEHRRKKAGKKFILDLIVTRGGNLIKRVIEWSSAIDFINVTCRGVSRKGIATRNRLHARWKESRTAESDRSYETRVITPRLEALQLLWFQTRSGSIPGPLSPEGRPPRSCLQRFSREFYIICVKRKMIPIQKAI